MNKIGPFFMLLAFNSLLVLNLLHPLQTYNLDLIYNV